MMLENFKNMEMEGGEIDQWARVLVSQEKDLSSDL